MSGDKNENFQPEIIVHQKALAKGAKVPRIIYYQNFCSEINNHSFIIIEEIKDQPISSCNDWDKLKQVFIEAGMDIAKINSIPVSGFGSAKFT